MLKNHEMFCKDHDHIDMLIPKKTKSALHKVANEVEEVAGNILKHLLGNKFFVSAFCCCL